MKILVLNLGNTTLFGGVFHGEKLHRSFRVLSRSILSSAGFARHVLPVLKGRIDRVAVCSVVPHQTASLLKAIRQHLGVLPDLLTVDAAHGLEIGYERPRELGTDRLAAMLGAQRLYPRQNVIVVDCGTATTVTALDRRGRLLGGAIFPGLTLSAATLAAGTAQLPRVEPARPARALGRGTHAGIASGVFYGQAGAIRELVQRIRVEAFGRSRVVVLGTGGHADVFGQENLFTRQEPALILSGLHGFAPRKIHHD